MQGRPHKKRAQGVKLNLEHQRYNFIARRFMNLCSDNEVLHSKGQTSPSALFCAFVEDRVIAPVATVRKSSVDTYQFEYNSIISYTLAKYPNRTLQL